MIWIKHNNTWTQRDEYYPTSDEDSAILSWLSKPYHLFLPRLEVDEDGNVVLEARLEDGVWTC